MGRRGKIPALHKETFFVTLRYAVPKLNQEAGMGNFSRADRITNHKPPGVPKQEALLYCRRGNGTARKTDLEWIWLEA